MNLNSVRQFSVDRFRGSRRSGRAQIAARPDGDRVLNDRAAHAIFAEIPVFERWCGAPVTFELQPIGPEGIGAIRMGMRRVVGPGGSVVGPVGLSVAVYWLPEKRIVVVPGVSTTVASPVFWRACRMPSISPKDIRAAMRHGHAASAFVSERRCLCQQQTRRSCCMRCY